MQTSAPTTKECNGKILKLLERDHAPVHGHRFKRSAFVQEGAFHVEKNRS
ncbi:MAG: hypothetical protein KIG95_14550 [Comamonas sp.]|nr:hypothetical protein [Comamonas sp.]